MSAYREEVGRWYIFPFHGNLLQCDDREGPTHYLCRGPAFGEAVTADLEEMTTLPLWVWLQIADAEAGEAKVRDEE